MRRLSKDFPAIHQRVLAGELSPNEDALKAGSGSLSIHSPQMQRKWVGTWLAEWTMIIDFELGYHNDQNQTSGLEEYQMVTFPGRQWYLSL